MCDPPICAWEDLGRVREEELRCAVNALGGASIHFSGYKDPEIGPDGELYPFTDDLDKAASKLKQKIIEIKPQVIFTHGLEGEYGHPGHIQAYQVMSHALAEIPDLSPMVFSPGYLSRQTSKFTPPPDFLLDISPWKEQKVKAALCHQSQHDLFIRNGSARAGRPVTIPEMIRPIEALSRTQLSGQIQDGTWILRTLSEISIPLNAFSE